MNYITTNTHTHTYIYKRLLSLTTIFRLAVFLETFLYDYLKTRKQHVLSFWKLQKLVFETKQTAPKILFKFLHGFTLLVA